ncbi:MAG: Asp-tRNA(Asn)/Glu-tRNA(Gln) amidotransferase subunit GatC [Patescibacteria group bacterium]
MTDFNTRDIDHLAALARLELSEEEKKRFEGQLASILAYVEKLNQVDTHEAAPTAHATGLVTVTRNDSVHDEGRQAEILKEAPAIEGKNYKVKSVF